MSKFSSVPTNGLAYVQFVFVFVFVFSYVIQLTNSLCTRVCGCKVLLCRSESLLSNTSALEAHCIIRGNTQR